MQQRASQAVSSQSNSIAMLRMTLHLSKYLLVVGELIDTPRGTCKGLIDEDEPKGKRQRELGRSRVRIPMPPSPISIVPSLR